MLEAQPDAIGRIRRAIMSDFSTDDDVANHLKLVGVICGQWAYLEWLLEVTHWWLLGLLNKPKEGRVITSSLSIEKMAKRVCDLSHLRISKDEDRALLENIKNRILAVLDERNLAVHGVRKWHEDEQVLTGSLARGKYKNEPQKLSLLRLRSLNNELVSIANALEPLLVRYNIIEGTTADLAR
jgi:hypothetical protein